MEDSDYHGKAFCAFDSVDSLGLVGERWSPFFEFSLSLAVGGGFKGIRKINSRAFFGFEMITSFMELEPSAAFVVSVVRAMNARFARNASSSRTRERFSWRSVSSSRRVLPLAIATASRA